MEVLYTFFVIEFCISLAFALITAVVVFVAVIKDLLGK